MCPLTIAIYSRNMQTPCRKRVDRDLLTYVERCDLCIAVVNEATGVVVCAVGCCRRAVEPQERAAAASAAACLLVTGEGHQRRRRRTWPRCRRRSSADTSRRHRAQTEVWRWWTTSWLQWRQKSRGRPVKMATHLQRQQRWSVHCCHSDWSAYGC